MRALLVLLLTLTLATPALAAFSGPGAAPAPAPAGQAGFQGPGTPGPQGGFQGPGVRTITEAAKVANAFEDTPCTLVGNLVEQVGRHLYVFRDQSGTTIVNIGPKKFRGQTVTPQTRIRIVGEVDYEDGHVEVDVDYLEIVR